MASIILTFQMFQNGDQREQIIIQIWLLLNLMAKWILMGAMSGTYNLSYCHQLVSMIASHILAAYGLPFLL